MTSFSIVPTNDLEINNLQIEVTKDGEEKVLTGKLAGDTNFYAGSPACTIAIVKLFDTKGKVTRIAALQIKNNGDLRLLDRTKPKPVEDPK